MHSSLHLEEANLSLRLCFLQLCHFGQLNFSETLFPEKNISNMNNNNHNNTCPNYIFKMVNIAQVNGCKIAFEQINHNTYISSYKICCSIEIFHFFLLFSTVHGSGLLGC